MWVWPGFVAPATTQHHIDRPKGTSDADLANVHRGCDGYLALRWLPMSSEATGWVFKHSPYSGATFAVHLAIADSANDQHDDEFWMRQAKLAVKARTTRKTVSAAIAQMVADRLLVLLEQGTGGANRYRLVMPTCAPLVFDKSAADGRGGVTPRDRGVSPVVTPGVTPRDRGVSPQVTHNPSKNPSGTQDVGTARAVDPFEAFWQRYPRKVAKPSAARAWRKVVDVDAVLAGLEGWCSYWTARAQPEYVPHPATWLNQERWNDQPPALPRTVGARGPVDADRTAPSGRVMDL